MFLVTANTDILSIFFLLSSARENYKIKAYNTRQVVLTSPISRNKSLKTNLYSLHGVNFTVWFVLHRSLWKVKHRISLIFIKSDVARGN